jgi:acyl-CoA synthetase (AMP-forming)/AMP-acid ligase II
VGGDGLADATTVELTAGFRGTACTTYGLTEAGPRVANHRLTDDPAGWDRLGRPLPGVSWRLAGDGALRELVVRTPTRAAGVLADCRFLPTEGTEVRTGDLCVATEDGGVRFVSRAHGVVTVGGEKVYLGLVERVLMQHPLVRAVRVRPVGEDPETLCAEVLTGGAELDAGALRGWCRGRLRAIEIPRIFLAAPEQAQLSK